MNEIKPQQTIEPKIDLDTNEVLIGVDLGGTRVRVARLDTALNIIERHETLTLAHEGYDATIKRIKGLIRRVLPTDDATPIAGIGVSAPGPLNPQTGVVVAPPNLPGWHNVPLGDILHEEFNLPIYVGNDANVAALAEVARGAAHGHRHAIYITVSTGIGSGIIYDGRLLLGKTGLAAEAGHMIMLADGTRVSSLEKEAAGPALARQARARIEAGESTLIAELVAGDLDKIDARVIGIAANQGDQMAVDIVERCGKFVGLGIVTLLHLFNPEIVIIGGGVSNIGDLLFSRIRATIEQHSLDSAYWDDLKLVPAGLAGDVSVIGAAVLVATKGGQSDVTQVLSIINRSL
jgi:glucokinase